MHAYNPRKKDYQQLDSSLVGADRRDFLNTVIKELSLRTGESPKQHWLVVGPRGIGKSHLLTLLYHKVKLTPDLHKLWIPVLFPEETRMESTLAKFLERAGNEIIHELQENDSKTAAALRDKIAKTKTLPVQERDDYLFSVLIWITETTGRYILFITENLQHLLGKKLSLIEQKKLRAFLQTSDTVTLLGSATTVFNALHDHSNPFYNFFHIHRLTDLSFDEMKVMIGAILTATGRADLAERVNENEARIKTLSVFTGGNPRMAVFLADILKTDVPEEMLDLMDGILDELTPYFETIFKDIPDCLEAVINTLAAYEPAQSPTEITDHLEGQSTTIRNYLKQLKDSGYVRVAFSRGRSNYYCLNEYLYRIWFQMRDSGHREETRWLLELLLMLYSPATLLEEKEKAENDCRIGDEAPHAYSRLIVQAADFMVANPAYCKVIEWCVASAKVDEDKAARTAKDKKVYKKVSKLIEAGKFDKAVIALKEYLEVNPDIEWAYRAIGFCLRKQKQYDEAIRHLRKALEIDPTNYLTYGIWGDCLRDTQNYPEAEEKYQQALTINPSCAVGYDAWGCSLKRQKRYEEALAKYQKAFEYDPSRKPRVCFMDCLRQLKRFDEAIELLKQHHLDQGKCSTVFYYGNLLLEAGQYQEASKELAELLKRKGKCTKAFLPYGRALAAASDQEDALEAYLKYIKFNLGNYFTDPDFQKLYQEDIQPILAKMTPGDYIEKLYTPAKAKDLSRTQNCMILVLLGKHEIVREHLPAILAATNEKSKAERDAQELLFYSIKFMLWINLSMGKIHEALSLTELYAEYIKSLPSMKNKELEVRSLALGLLQLQIAKNIEPESTKKIFLQLGSDNDIPFAEVLLKVLTCISEPDSLQSQQFMSDKIIAEVVKGLTPPKKKKESPCDSCGVSC